MDGSWQIKCASSTWSSPPSLPSLGPGNQMDMNLGHYFHPYVAQEANRAERAIIQEPMVFSTLNLGSGKSGKPEQGNSFLALLSGPSQQLQCEYPQLSDSRSSVAANSGVVVNGSGCGFPVNHISSFSQPYGKVGMGNGMGDVSELRPASLHFGGSDFTKSVIHHGVDRNETGMEGSSQRRGWLAGMSPPNVGQHLTANTLVSSKVLSRDKSVMSGYPPSFAKGQPRVFCLRISGELLLSETGLLGVVCFCHDVLMSVAKFCEHSGSCDFNPGNAVRMESGETVAQWRRLNFRKLGIRVPDENCGWEWPDGISVPVSLVKSVTTAAPDIPKNPEILRPVDLFGGLARSGLPCRDFVSPSTPCFGQASEKPVNKNMHSPSPMNSLGGHNVLLKSFAGTSKSVLPSLADNPAFQASKGNHMARGRPMSKSALNRGRQDNGYQSVVDYIELVSKGGNPFISNPCLGNLKSFTNDSDTRSCYNSREACIMDRDAVSSSIELRLGQPSQQIHTLGAPIPPAMQPQPFEILCDSQKSQFNEPLINRVVTPRAMEESRHDPWFAPSDASNSNTKEKESHTNFMCHSLKSINAVDPVKVGQFKVDPPAKNSQISMFRSNFSNPLEGGIQFQATDNLVNNSAHFMPRALDGDQASHMVKSRPADFPRNRTDGRRWKFSIDESGLSDHVDKGKASGPVTHNYSHIAAIPDSLVHNRHLANSSPSTGIIGGSYLHSSFSKHDRQPSPYLHQLPGMLPDASDPDHTLLGSINSAPVTAGPGLPSSVAPLVVPSTNPIYLPNLTAAWPNYKSGDMNSYLLDENKRLLALRHAVELSKQEHGITSFLTNPEGTLYCPSVSEMQRKGFKQDPVAAPIHRKGLYSTIRQDTSEGAARRLQACCNHYMGGDGRENFSAMADLNNYYNFSACTQGNSLHSKEVDVQCPPCNDRGADGQFERPLLRLERFEGKTIESDEHERCSRKDVNPYFPGVCSCAVQSKCLAGSCVSKGGTPVDAGGKHNEGVDVEASILGASIFDKGHINREDKSIILSQFVSVKKHGPLKNHCHSAQWRDVPSKVIRNSNAPAIERPARVFDGKETDKNHLADTAAKGFDGIRQEPESLKEQQMSNVCSGCSALSVTEVSIEYNIDSCAADAANARLLHNYVIDEGSGIDRCCSSDDELDSGRWSESLNATGKVDSMLEGFSSTLPDQSCDLINELKLRNSFPLKRVRNQLYAGCNLEEKTHHTKKIGKELKDRNKKRTTKWKKLDVSFPVSGLSSMHYNSSNCTGNSELHFHSSKETEMPLERNGTQKKCQSTGPSSLKRKRSASSSAKTLSRKRNLHALEDHQREWEHDRQTQTNTAENLFRIPKISAGKKVRNEQTIDVKNQSSKPEVNRVGEGKAPKCISLSSVENISCHEVDIHKKTRPEVSGNFGIISNGKLAGGRPKPPKIISLSSILKIARRCTVTESKVEPNLTSVLETKKSRASRNGGCYEELFILKKAGDNECKNKIIIKEEDHISSSGLECKKECFNRSKGCADEVVNLKKGRNRGGYKTKKVGIPHGCPSPRLKPRLKETRKRSLYELTWKGKHATKLECLPYHWGNVHAKISSQSGLAVAISGKHPSPRKSCRKKILESTLKTTFRSYRRASVRNAEFAQGHTGDLNHVTAKKSVIKERKFQPFLLDSDAFCCVCGSSNKDEVNRLLECNHCLIRVHQACYGVSKVPKVSWCCRPCRTSSKNIVCVLCGYEGGAMTRALRSQNIVKSLLKAWNVRTESKSMNSIPSSETVNNDLSVLYDPTARTDFELKGPDSVPVTRPVNVEPFSQDMLNIDFQIETSNSNNLPSNSHVHNTVTAGVLDPTIFQWVHMVCGLWMPGTRCPNVDTMGAFDVSGVLQAKQDIVCSMCNRPGGSCIKCRVLDCSVHFHPWCAHQKGLLQSEIEGTDDEKVGFYGRCIFHATHHGYHADNNYVEPKLKSPWKKEFTCARTEGYKGRKREEGFQHILHGQSNDNTGCLVPQEQINAWLHINSQKSSVRGIVKLLASDIEYDCRKEYTRYKQAKGWKHLVVYKSGIHALGLYTSQFISRGAMVVEYVGEIVGLRVADKREIEYQSGRKLQYKSACYFFRIDKDHIIDATCKGGIARFVNHSCLPNCVAKVISVRNEKKVVFFAERDINPGEEITYDYHFNHEDEGKKIPCFCNSKNCRRYLN